MADERPEVATKVVIPHGDGFGDGLAGANTAVTEVAKNYTSVELLHAVDKLSFDTSIALSALADRLGQRKRDIEELLTIAKTGYELSKKVQRLGERLLAEGIVDVR